MQDGMEEREERKACDGAKVIQLPRGLNQPIPGHLGQSTHISLKLKASALKQDVYFSE